jgi:branched-chain amino acid transport system substrate-binding protein
MAHFNLYRLAPIVLCALLFCGVAPTRAADTYEINAIFSLTGDHAYLGANQLLALKALEAYVNKTGGIGGRPVSFVAGDDQSNPRIALQLAQILIAKRVPIILGAGLPASCAAITPLVVQAGPILYCVTNSGQATEGSYVFSSPAAGASMLAVLVRYLRERGWHRIAYIVATDAGGQDAERSLLRAAGNPENKSLRIVARQYFAGSDLSVDAQMAVIKAAKPDVVIAWGTGTAAGTLFRGIKNSGIDVPIATATGNLNAAFFQQYGQLLPANLYLASVPYYAGDMLSDGATKAALATLTTALATVGAQPDNVNISVWDPGLLLVDALRKLGPDASAAQLRAYLSNLSGWVGTLGPYDFRASPQSGLGESNVIIVKWDPQRGAVSGVSKFGGAPLSVK